ncbi:MAG: hypothetical protein PHR82_10060 [Endomicrobiaceae bacterium]|nr:hypothetical protein [Endomicrobiaceae bacterium]
MNLKKYGRFYNSKFFLISLPFLTSILIAIVIYCIALEIENNIKELLINISASLFAIPIIYLCYQTFKNFVDKKLIYEIIEYSKFKADSEILSIVGQLKKLVYPLENRDSTLEGINNFLNLENKDIEKIIEKNQYIGFQVFKHWEITEKNLTELLNNPLFINKMDNELIICIINIIKNIYTLSKVLEIKDLYIELDKICTDYKVVKGNKINKDNDKYPDRYILLKYLDNDKYVVSDFGDIYLYNEEKCLKLYMVNKKLIYLLAATIYDLIKNLKEWGNLTGKEFIIDEKMFRIRKNLNKNNSVPK